MGYYTDYTLSVYGAQKGKDGSILMTADFSKILEDLIDAEIEKMNMFTDGSIQDSYYGNGTWYDHEDDMRLLSAKFPDNVFWLSGHGTTRRICGRSSLWPDVCRNATPRSSTTTLTPGNWTRRPTWMWPQEGTATRNSEVLT